GMTGDAPDRVLVIHWTPPSALSEQILYCLLVDPGRRELSAVFAHELPTRSAGFDAENRLYLFALTVPSRYWIRYCTLEILALKHPGRGVGGDPPAALRVAAKEHCGQS